MTTVPPQMSETWQTYDVIWPEFAERTQVATLEITERIAELARVLPPGGRVADIGCGPGRDAVLMRERGLRVVGVDLSIGQLRARHVPGLVQADMCHLPLRAGSVDAIWCQAALLHLPRDLVPTALAEFARAVRAGGALSLSLAEGDGEGFEVAAKYASERRRWFTLHRAPELTAQLATAGFTVTQVRHHHANRDMISLSATR